MDPLLGPGDAVSSCGASSPHARCGGRRLRSGGSAAACRTAPDLVFLSFSADNPLMAEIGQRTLTELLA
jgi:hypothetical protein